jgi:hypothetical protein
MAETTKDQILALIGDPRDVEREMEEFRENAKRLSSHHERLIEEYPKQWVAIFENEVRARASTLRGLVKEIETLGLPRRRVVVRYIDKEERTMIL